MAELIVGIVLFSLCAAVVVGVHYADQRTARFAREQAERSNRVHEARRAADAERMAALRARIGKA